MLSKNMCCLGKLSRIFHQQTITSTSFLEFLGWGSAIDTPQICFVPFQLPNEKNLLTSRPFPSACKGMLSDVRHGVGYRQGFQGKAVLFGTRLSGGDPKNPWF